MSTVFEVDDGVLLVVVVVLLLLPQPASTSSAPTRKIPAFLLATNSTTPIRLVDRRLIAVTPVTSGSQLNQGTPLETGTRDS
jgi:hypothetical protein